MCHSLRKIIGEQMWGVGKPSKETQHYSALGHVFTDSLMLGVFPLSWHIHSCPLRTTLSTSLWIFHTFFTYSHPYLNITVGSSNIGRTPLIIKHLLQTSNQDL